MSSCLFPSVFWFGCKIWYVSFLVTYFYFLQEILCLYMLDLFPVVNSFILQMLLFFSSKHVLSHGNPRRNILNYEPPPSLLPFPLPSTLPQVVLSLKVTRQNNSIATIALGPFGGFSSQFATDLLTIFDDH